MGKVKYGTFVEKILICSNCDDGDSICKVILKRKVLKNCQKPSDIGKPKWIRDGECIHRSFYDANWIEVSDSESEIEVDNMKDKKDKKDMKCPKCEFEGDHIDFHCNVDEGFCPNCDFVGSNTELSINRCPACKGKGSFLCNQADSSTQVECEDCKGSGLKQEKK